MGSMVPADSGAERLFYSIPADAWSDLTNNNCPQRSGIEKLRGDKLKTMDTATITTEELVNHEYKYGFVTDIENDTVPRGLNKKIVSLISAKKNEPNFMLDWRLKALPALGETGKVTGRTKMGQRSLSADRLSGPHLLLGAKDKRGVKEPRRGRPKAA
jgi:hypothetical protein